MIKSKNEERKSTNEKNIKKNNINNAHISYGSC